MQILLPQILWKDILVILLLLRGGGCGKTSHVPGLVERLRDRGCDVFPTREPGGTSIGEQIREVIHDMKNVGMDPRTETLLYQASRAEFVEKVIILRLEDQEIIISDRFADSTFAYQGYGHRQDIQKLMPLINYATGGLVPDLTILLDVDVEIGIDRKKQQGSEWNRMDALSPEFHQRVRDGYLQMAREEPSRWVIIDANVGIGQVFDNLVDVVESKLASVGLLER